MTHIPDEAVKAAKKAVSERCKRTYLTSDQMFAALAAALPHLSAPCAVEVKQLEWVSAPNQAGKEGLWFISIDQIGRKHEIIKTFNGQLGDGWTYRATWFKGIEEAKAAAQADFERRILSCVVTMPVAIPTKEERHANTARNLIINQTSTDLEDIINGHDPEQSILNNDVWDRLDKMACEIEALAKPVDVAAVRIADYGMLVAPDGGSPTKAETDVALNIAEAIRALSTEPAQEK